MAQGYQKIGFQGGLNQDDEDRFLPNTDYRFALNVRAGSSDGQDDGAIESVQGNILISFTLPSGTNKCIGSLYEEEGQTVIYFVFNSNGDHSILRYFPREGANGEIEIIIQDSVLNFFEDGKITHANLIDNLLYWTDVTEDGDDLKGNPPRKINIEKANLDKPCETNLYFDAPLNGNVLVPGTIYSISAVDDDGNNVLFDTQVYTASIEADGNPEKGSNEMAIAINANAIVTQFFTAKSVGSGVELTTVANGRVDVTFTSNNNNESTRVILQNMYPQTLIQEHIDRVKYPPKCQPTLVLGNDVDRNVNYLNRSVFQFNIRYIMDDNEKTAWSPISVIGFVPSTCTDDAQPFNNFIDVDFKEQRITDLAETNIIKRVEIAVRFSNNGRFMSVITLEQGEIGINDSFFRFFNDGTYETLPDTNATTKLFDLVGQKVKGTEFIRNRLIDGDILEGYDNIPIDVDLNIAYSEESTTETGSVSGDLFIRNLFTNNIDFAWHQPIHDDGEGIGFGGFIRGNYVEEYNTSYNQILPLGGFTIYLAGTNHFTLSRQVVGTGEIQQGLQNSYDSSTVRKRNKIRDNVRGSGDTDETPSTRAFSQWTISNVPPGKYIVRVASHLTTQQDLEDPTRAWQNTSTYTLQVGGDQTPGNQVSGFTTEMEIEIKAGENFDIGRISIADLTNPKTGNSRVLSGYVTDMDAPVTDPAQSDTRIQVAGIEFNLRGNGLNFFANHVYRVINLWNVFSIRSMTTDHNGFYFFATNGGATALTPTFTFSGNTDLMEILLNEDGSAFVASAAGKHSFCVIRNQNQNVSDFSRTVLLGNISIGGTVPLPGISVPGTFLSTSQTDADGDFQVFLYASVIIFDNTQLLRGETILLFANSQESCVLSYDPVSESINIEIDENTNPEPASPPPYSDQGDDGQFWYEINNGDPVDATLETDPQSTAFKRGYNGQLGIVYYDRAQRSGATNANSESNLRIVFYTEIDPETGVIPPGGIPEVSWTVSHLPPDFATHWQWVRTKNNALNFYLNWAAEKVEYFQDDLTTAATPSTATKIVIDLSNLTTYSERNPNSVLNYTFTIGDRIRFIREKDGDLFTEYFDVEIVSVTNDGDIVIDNNLSFPFLETGFQYEIYTPKLQDDVNLFFEFGECFDVGIDNNGNKFHKGAVTEDDQDPLNPVGIPAKGIFNTGDVYYRTRSIPIGTTTLLAPVDTELVSDFFESREQSIGRVNIIDANAEQARRKTTLRYSNVYVSQTSINGLSSFDGTAEQDMPREFGPIYKLQTSENVLMVIHEFRWVAIYVDERITSNLTGDSSVILTDSVLGGFRALRGKYGTKNPESVVEYAGMIWAWDVNKGRVIRYASNGLFPISDLKMRNYFSDKGKQRINLPDPSKSLVQGTYHPEFNSYVMSFNTFGFITDNIPVLIPGDTLTFNETTKRWTSFFSYEPEEFQTIGQDIISFDQGNLYLHNTAGSGYNNFFGTQFTSKVHIVGNGEPSKVKSWQALTLESDLVWSATEITIPINDTYKFGMESSLKETDFRKKEGVFYAAFKRDILTPGITNQLEALVDGRKLRGKVINVTLEYTGTELVILYAVDLLYSQSERSGK